jgi:hypothetical protein
VDEHLSDKLDVPDVNIISEKETGRFMVSILVVARDDESEGAVLNQAIGTMRSAFHACDGLTPGMEPPFEGASIREAMVVEGVLV